MMKFARLFFYFAAVLLLLTAAAKFISSFGHARILLQRDPLTGFKFQDLFRVVGLIEASVALICFFSRRIWFQAGLVAWLATSLLGYRVWLAWIDYHGPCRCLGNLTDALHISPYAADMIMKTILTYLLLGSYSILFLLWRQKQIKNTVLRQSDISTPVP